MAKQVFCTMCSSGTLGGFADSFGAKRNDFETASSEQDEHRTTQTRPIFRPSYFSTLSLSSFLLSYRSNQERPYSRPCSKFESLASDSILSIPRFHRHIHPHMTNEGDDFLKCFVVFFFNNESVAPVSSFLTTWANSPSPPLNSAELKERHKKRLLMLLV